MNRDRPSENVTPIERLVRPFQEFARLEASGGILLIGCTIVALIWANSPWAASYFSLWHLHPTFGLAGKLLSESLHFWINDGLMALFFLAVGLEIKRETLIGELASFRKAALPIAAALGGMIVPAGLYVLLNHGGPAVAGWGIPMATDIAFALGVLALLGARVPTSLRVFLAALAIVDDIGAGTGNRVFLHRTNFVDEPRSGRLLFPSADCRESGGRATSTNLYDPRPWIVARICPIRRPSHRCRSVACDDNPRAPRPCIRSSRP